MTLASPGDGRKVKGKKMAFTAKLQYSKTFFKSSINASYFSDPLLLSLIFCTVKLKKG